MRNRAAGRIVLVVGLFCWTALGARLLPFDYVDLCYLFSLENKRWVTQEWVHPLYIPFLSVYQAFLRGWGYSGKMLLPVEILNLSIACLMIGGLYLFLERKCRLPVIAAFSVFLLGLAPGFEIACLRPTPYALAAACVLLALMAMADFSSLPAETRFGGAGLAAGAAAAFHLSGLSLIPVAAVGIWKTEGVEHRRGDLFFIFLTRFLLVVLASYALFIRREFGFASLRSLDFGHTFRGVEQVPGTSIYSSLSLKRQLLDFSVSLFSQGAPLIFASGLCLLVLLGSPSLWSAVRKNLQGQNRLVFRVGAANFCAFSAFFFINNSKNGFIFAALLFVPIMLALVAEGVPGLSLLLMPVVLGGTVLGMLVMRRDPKSGFHDPMLNEERFLSENLGARDILLLPGCPFPELFYLHHFNILIVGDGSCDQERCGVPKADKEWPDRVSDYLTQGRKVYFSEGETEFSPSGDISGEWKKRQIFEDDYPNPARRREKMQALQNALRARFDFKRAMLSPQGIAYYGLSLRASDDGMRKSEKKPRRLIQGRPPDFAALHGILTTYGASPNVRAMLDYLETWNEQDPRDPYVIEDLARILREWALGQSTDNVTRSQLIKSLNKSLGAVVER